MTGAWFRIKAVEKDNGTGDTGRAPAVVSEMTGVYWSGNYLANSPQWFGVVRGTTGQLDTVRDDPNTTELTADNAIRALRGVGTVNDTATAASWDPDA